MLVLRVLSTRSLSGNAARDIRPPRAPWRWILCIFALSFLIDLGWNSRALADGPKGAAFHPSRILIKRKSGKDLKSLHARHGARVLRRQTDLDLEVIELPGSSNVLDTVAAYQQSGEVEFAEPDYILHAATTPDDPLYNQGQQWALHNTGQNGGQPGADLSAEGAWTLLNTASNVVVAVIDSGIRYTHQDLAPNLWSNPGEKPGNAQDDDRDGFIDDVHGINALTGSGDPRDDNGHGTHIAGIIGAAGNNGKGIVGVAWKVQLMACKFMDSTGEGATSDAITCIDYARKHGAQIINASWGGPAYSYSLQSAIKRARSAGIVFVVAAGNESQDLDQQHSYPANYTLDNIVAVAATTREDLLADYSNFGVTSVLLAAPGSEILSTWNSSDDAYVVASGTSMATPYVAGVFALTKARFPTETYLQLIKRVKAAVDPLKDLSGKCITGGRVNLRRAIGAPDPAGLARLSVTSASQTGSLEFSLAGEPGTSYSIETSSDLMTWTPLFTRQASDQGQLTFTDPDGAAAAQRFYRARLVPLQGQ